MSPPAGLLKFMFDASVRADGRKLSVADYEWMIGASADDASAHDAICSLLVRGTTRQPEEMYTILLAVAAAAGPKAALRFALTLLRSYLSWSRKVCSTVALTIQIAGELSASADADCESRMIGITREAVFRCNYDPTWRAAIRGAQLVRWSSPEAENADFKQWITYYVYPHINPTSIQVLQYLAANAWPGDVASCVDDEKTVAQILAVMRTPTDADESSTIDVSIFARMAAEEEAEKK